MKGEMEMSLRKQLAQSPFVKGELKMRATEVDAEGGNLICFPILIGTFRHGSAGRVRSEPRTLAGGWDSVDWISPTPLSPPE